MCKKGENIKKMAANIFYLFSGALNPFGLSEWQLLAMNLRNRKSGIDEDDSVWKSALSGIVFFSVHQIHQTKRNVA